MAGLEDSRHLVQLDCVTVGRQGCRMQETGTAKPEMTAYDRIRQRQVTRLLAQKRCGRIRPIASCPTRDSSMASQTEDLRERPSETSARDRLDSWKEIAAYLNCSERTVRRCEEDGLPVHRHTH